MLETPRIYAVVIPPFRFPENAIVIHTALETAAKSRALASDPDRRKPLESQARKTALRFDRSAIGKRQAEIYAELVSSLSAFPHDRRSGS